MPDPHRADRQSLGHSGKAADSGKKGLRQNPGKAMPYCQEWFAPPHRLTFSIGVFNAQDKSAALMTRKGPRIERRADIAEMDQSRRTWRKTGANLGSHQGLG